MNVQILFFFLLSTTAVQGYWSDECWAQWHKVGDNHCVRVFNEASASWSRTRRVCQEHGGDLVQLHDSEIFQWVRGVMQLESEYFGDDPPSTYWIGAFKFGEATRWVDGTWMVEGRWKLPAGDHTSYSRAPKYSRYHHNCALLNSAVELSYGHCYKSNNFICQVSATKTTTARTTTTPKPMSATKTTTARTTTTPKPKTTIYPESTVVLTSIRDRQTFEPIEEGNKVTGKSSDMTAMNDNHTQAPMTKTKGTPSSSILSTDHIVAIVVGSIVVVVIIAMVIIFLLVKKRKTDDRQLLDHTRSGFDHAQYSKFRENSDRKDEVQSSE